jgi:hypothetical protein
VAIPQQGLDEKKEYIHRTFNLIEKPKSAVHGKTIWLSPPAIEVLSSLPRLERQSVRHRGRARGRTPRQRPQGLGAH